MNTIKLKFFSKIVELYNLAYYLYYLDWIGQFLQLFFS
jgi:hypothetical protein